MARSGERVADIRGARVEVVARYDRNVLAPKRRRTEIVSAHVRIVTDDWIVRAFDAVDADIDGTHVTIIARYPVEARAVDRIAVIVGALITVTAAFDLVRTNHVRSVEQTGIYRTRIRIVASSDDERTRSVRRFAPGCRAWIAAAGTMKLGVSARAVDLGATIESAFVVIFAFIVIRARS